MRAVDRMVWFKYALSDELSSASMDQLHELVQLYIERNDEEISSLKDSLRPGRPKPNKLIMLELLRSKDAKEYEVGICKS
jgi:translation machinery-associated protein 16